MAAPTNAAFVKKALANSEPSTHGPSQHVALPHDGCCKRSEADINFAALPRGFMSTRPEQLYASSAALDLTFL